MINDWVIFEDFTEPLQASRAAEILSNFILCRSDTQYGFATFGQKFKDLLANSWRLVSLFGRHQYIHLAS